MNAQGNKRICQSHKLIGMLLLCGGMMMQAACGLGGAAHIEQTCQTMFDDICQKNLLCSTGEQLQPAMLQFCKQQTASAQRCNYENMTAVQMHRLEELGASNCHARIMSCSCTEDGIDCGKGCNVFLNDAIEALGKKR